MKIPRTRKRVGFRIHLGEQGSSSSPANNRPTMLMLSFRVSDIPTVIRISDLFSELFFLFQNQELLRDRALQLPPVAIPRCITPNGIRRGYQHASLFTCSSLLPEFWGSHAFGLCEFMTVKTESDVRRQSEDARSQQETRLETRLV